MDDLRARIEKLSPKRLALLALELQDRVDRLERQQNEPIAVIGMGCRVPGPGGDLDAFWRLLEEGRDAIAEIPPERWDAEAYFHPDPDAPGRMATRWGGFLEDIAGFDAPFFGIARREANSMDPQQRLLLEVCWETLENAGYCPRKAAGGAVGVFTGITTTDYHSLMLERGEESITVHMATGSGNNIAGGRISYVLALQGPNLSVDTACSSSLVALHLACQSLRAGECKMALAAGVNALLAPELFIALSKAHALSPDGRCKAFDARANGFARAEGCGAVLLKPLSQALADGDHIDAVIRGTAVNQDGRSSGMTAPNGAAQEAVIRQALAQGGLAPADVDYVEAHGTGTALGDPIEAHALAAALGPNRAPNHPLILGSVKTNLGHLEAAAGIVGLIKVILSLRHQTIPRHLHFESLNPHIDWKGVPVEIAAQPLPWPRSERPRMAGLNSFGLSGTNAHVIVAEAPEPPSRPALPDRPLHLLTLSARTEPALAALRDRYRDYLAGCPQPLGDICYTAAAGRAHFEHRAAYIAADPAAMLAALAAAPASSGLAPTAQPVVFLFPGQGAQYSGMARQLYDTHPVFRESIDECARLLETHIDVPLRELLWGETSHAIDQTAFAQPALFAVEYALAHLWMSWGVEPAAVAGHSVGEYVAACIAGVFSLEDGLKLIAARGRLMQNVAGEGAMAAVIADEDRVRRALAGFEDRVAVAALNAPANTVISGFRADLESVQQTLEQDGIRVQRLPVSHAFHSPQMRTMEPAFDQCASTIELHSPRIRIISSVTGLEIENDVCDPAYWRRQVAQPVRFRDLVRTLRTFGYRIFLEVGPGSTLAALGKQCAEDGETAWLPSLRKSRDEWRQMLDTLAHLYTLGAPIDWSGFEQPWARLRVPLPTYPFQREPCWFEERKHTRLPGGKTSAASGIDNWFYTLAWKQKDPPDRAPLPPRWLLVPDSKGVAAAFARRLEGAGATVVLADSHSLSQHLRDHFDCVFHAVALDHVPAAELRQDAPAVAHSVLSGAIETAQALIAGNHRARLWFATCGAQPVLSATDGWNAIHAPLCGLARTFAQEHADNWGGLVDLDPSASPAEMADTLFSAMSRSDREDEVAFRNGRRFVARLERHRESRSEQPPLSADKTYLITGGAGGLGLQIAAWMADHGARHVLLIGRKAPAAEAEATLTALRQRGVSVEFRSADVTLRPQLESIFGEFGAAMPALGGVVHAAGVLDDSVFANLTPERLASVLAPKFEGAWNLHLLTTRLPLEFFVMFSSLAAITGSTGQSAYSAANGFLDGLAHYRAARGLPALSLNWGAWAGAGMAGRVEARPRSGPFQPMRADRAVDAFGRMLGSAAIQLSVADVDWDRLATSAGPGELRPVFSSMLPASAAPAAARFDPEDFASLPAEVLRLKLVRYFTSALAPVLGIEEAAIAPARSLVELGLDSLMALEFRNRIRTDLGVTVATANLLQGPSLEELADAIAPQLHTAQTMESETASPESRRSRMIAYLQRALASTLEVDEAAISAARSLLDMGLDSLMALEFRNRIRTNLGVTMATATLLAGPTLEQLADDITARLIAPGTAREEKHPSPAPKKYPLSYSQQSQWFGHKLAGSSTLNVGFTAAAIPALQWDALRNALARTVDRHPALRTAILEIEPGRPVQRVADSISPDLELIDASTWTEAELKERLLAAFRQPFALDRPMMRMRVFHVSENRDVLLLAVDHLMVDASSLALCFEDLREYYGAELAHTQPALKPLSVDFSDFVAWEAAQAEGPESEPLWKFWSQTLAGPLPVLELPSSRPRPDVLLPKGTESVFVPFGPALSAAVHSLARENRATPYSVILAAYLLLLKLYCGQDDIIVGTSVSQRDDERWQKIAGLFINVVPLRVNLSGDPSFTDHLARVRQTTLDAFAHQALPFPALVKRLALPRNLRHTPVFQAFLNFLQDRNGGLGGLMTPEGNAAIPFGTSTLRPFMVIPQEDGLAEIALSIGQNQDRFAGNLIFNEDLMDRATAEAMAGSFLEILERVTAHPERPIGELVTLVAESQEREEFLL